MRPYEGIKIIDITHVLAGPFAAYQLALLGADVIKVEHPKDYDQSRDSGGDRAFNEQRMGTGFLTQASNKRAITLDLKQPKGREILKKLVKDADVLVENWRSGAFPALGLGWDDLRPINPRLIYCSMTAFGQDGPRGEQTAYDQLIQATSGMMAMTGTPDVNPIKTGAPVIDYATGTMCAFAISVGALPARAHRARPVHRQRHARRVADADGLAHHVVPAHGPRAQAQGQPDGARQQPALSGQGRAADDRRQQSRPARAAVQRGRTSRTSPHSRATTSATASTSSRPRSSTRSSRSAPPTSGSSTFSRVTFPLAACAASPSPSTDPQLKARGVLHEHNEDRRHRGPGHRAGGRVQVRRRWTEHRDAAAAPGPAHRRGAGESRLLEGGDRDATRGRRDLNRYGKRSATAI